LVILTWIVQRETQSSLLGRAAPPRFLFRGVVFSLLTIGGFSASFLPAKRRFPGSVHFFVTHLFLVSATITGRGIRWFSLRSFFGALLPTAVPK